jgi:ribosomal protein L40E
MQCLKCGSENSVDGRFCRGCGNKLEETEQVDTGRFIDCPKCGHANEPGKKFCPKCGASLIDVAPVPEAPVPGGVIEAVLLAAVGGGDDWHDQKQEGGNTQCLKCGSENGVDAKFCRGCGNTLERIESVVTSSLVECEKCGHVNEPGKKFCPKCGASLVDVAPVPEVPAPGGVIEAVLLAAVGGGDDWHDQKQEGGSTQCLKCGSENSVDAKFCRGCGNKLEGTGQVTTGS